MAGEKVMEQTGSDELCERLEQLAQAIESQVEAINGLSSARGASGCGSC